MGYSFPGEETAQFQEHSSIEQNFWNQKLALTTAVLRRGVEMSML